MANPAMQSRVSAAITIFKTNMLTSNTRYVSLLATQSTSLPPSKRLRNFLRAIKYESTLPRDITTPEEFIAHPTASHRPEELSGVHPPKPENEVTRYVKSLTMKVNEHFEPDDEGALELPEEYVAMLKVCDGVWDVDLRRNEVVGINGTNCLDAEGWPFVGKFANWQQIDFDEERKYGWDQITGWYLDGNVMQSCVYFYSQRTSVGIGGPIQDHETEWGWRIFYRDVDLQSDTALRVFQGIPEFLEWLGGWWERDVGEAEIMMDLPYEEGMDHVFEEDDQEDDEESDEEEDAVALERQELMLREFETPEETRERHEAEAAQRSQ